MHAHSIQATGRLVLSDGRAISAITGNNNGGTNRLLYNDDNLTYTVRGTCARILLRHSTQEPNSFDTTVSITTDVQVGDLRLAVISDDVEQVCNDRHYDIPSVRRSLCMHLCSNG